MLIFVILKPMVQIKRLENLQLDSQAFADLLMVVEFVNNFGSVLKISKILLILYLSSNIKPVGSAMFFKAYLVAYY